MLRPAPLSFHLTVSALSFLTWEQIEGRQKGCAFGGMARRVQETVRLTDFFVSSQLCLERVAMSW